MRFIISVLLCLLCILQINAEDKASKVVEFAKSKLGCGYVWGASGEKLTVKTLEDLYNRHKDHVDKSIVKRWIGLQVYDCSGLVRAAFKTVGLDLYHNAESAWKTTKWQDKGTISNYPKDKVVVLYKYDKSKQKMVHTGIYIGGGKFIHAKGSKYGVVKESMPDSWTHWGIPKGLY